MSRQMILVFGASGSGTSTLGRYICDRTGSFFMDVDDYFWEPTDPPFTTKRERAERIRLMRADMEKHESVVLSGSIVGWGDELVPLFTLAVRVHTPKPVRMERINRRERERFGSRLDEGGDMFEIHRAFMEWAASYDDGGLDHRSTALHDLWQKQLHCPIVLADGSLPPEENYKVIQIHLEKQGKTDPERIRLIPMTDEMYRRYLKEYENDPDLFRQGQQYVPYDNSEERIVQYIRHQKELKRVPLAIMLDNEIAGEIVIKNIKEHECATMGIALKNAGYKDRGIGTQAEKLAVRYVFSELDIPVLYADTLQTNTRSRHVLEKTGFTLIREDQEFRYYQIRRD